MRIVIAQVDEIFFDGEARSLTVPGSEGEMTVLPEHMPLITTLKQGTITVRGEEDSELKRLDISGGILEVHGDGATVVL